MKRSAISFVLAAASLLATSSAFAQAKIKVGTLTCTGGAGIGLVVGSKKTYDCKFTSATSAHSETYSASITKIGLDIGVTNKSVMIWTVLSSTEVPKRGLVGNYAGATADVAVGVGGGAKVLLGGSKKSIALQPISVQGQTGLNLAVGVAELSIR